MIFNDSMRDTFHDIMRAGDNNTNTDAIEEGSQVRRIVQGSGPSSA